MQQVPLAYAPSSASTQQQRVTPLEGATSFVSEEEQEQRSIELLGAGALVVRLPPPTSHVRGHLASLLEELVERELARAGAPSPYLAAWSAMPDEANARLADQLLRARAVGASGLAIGMGTLTHIAQPSLCPDDSAILRWLAEATTALPLVVMLDDADMHLTGYAAPKPLLDLLGERDAPVALSGDDATAIESAVVASIDVAEAIADAAPDTDACSEPVHTPLANADSAEPAGSPSVVAGGTGEQKPILELDLADAMTEDEHARGSDADGNEKSARADEADAPTRRLPRTRRIASGAALLRAVMTPPAPAADSPIENAEVAAPRGGDASPEINPAAKSDADHVLAEKPAAIDAIATNATERGAGLTPPQDTQGDRATTRGAGLAPQQATQRDAANPRATAASAVETAVNATPRMAASRPVEPPGERRAPRARTARSAVAGAMEVTAGDAWRTWTLALSAARGAQPLAAFEKLFTESYVPLAQAIAAGLDDPRAVRAFDEFRRAFERSYTDAFATFGATNRRPRLVMDIFDLAIKNARLVGARSAHILLVDSMRFDLGAMVKDALGREASGVATLQSETLLWAALPTTTMRQLETLARGMDAIRAPAAEEPSESLRGRAAEVVRRFRLGSREIYKLDLVPALLENAGANAITELPAIAQSVAEAVARHVTTLAPRTLLYIVGDHGFTIDRRGELHTGGASPEEVLVPAQAWLIGDLH